MNSPREDPSWASTCWGASILDNDGRNCTPGFTSGTAHFKNKFCHSCRLLIEVPETRVRALKDDMKKLYANSLREGFWKRAPKELGGGECRLANNTITCDGPWLVIYRERPPNYDWDVLPARWVVDGKVRLCVAKGTLVPVSELHNPGRKPLRATDGASSRSTQRKRRLNEVGVSAHDMLPPLSSAMPHSMSDASPLVSATLTAMSVPVNATASAGGLPTAMASVGEGGEMAAQLLPSSAAQLAASEVGFRDTRTKKVVRMLNCTRH